MGNEQCKNYWLTVHILSSKSVMRECEEVAEDQNTYTSEGVKSSSLSRGWSRSVNISETPNVSVGLHQ